MIKETRLKEMADEVRQFCREKGWDDTPVSFPEAMALLHTEVDEMWLAYCTNGLEPFWHENGGPDGVAIELADVLIRALDDCGRFGLWPVIPIFRFSRGHQRNEAAAFSDAVLDLHGAISLATEVYRVTGMDPVHNGVPDRFSAVFGCVYAIASRFTLDLEKAYTEKMTYNWKRAYRHGNKRC